MKAWIAALMLVASILGVSGAMAQTKKFDVVAEFPGTYLKWIRIAEPEFKRRNLNLDNYTISIIDEGDSVIVLIISSDAPKDNFPASSCKGSCGTYPGFDVEISKKDSKIIRSSYER